MTIESEYSREIKDIEEAREEREKRRQSMIGTVVSTKNAKSITVQVIRDKFYPKYNKTLTVRKKVMAHDETSLAEMGDFVRIVPCRPMSRKKRHSLIDILRKGKKLE